MGSKVYPKHERTMKQQHTLGPWKVDGTYIYEVGQDKIIAEVETYNNGELPYEANARLIAESPELYRKLKKAIQYIGLAACNSDKEFQEKMEFLADVMVSIKKIEGDECNHLP